MLSIGVLGRDAISSAPGGYRLDGAVRVDAVEFERGLPPAPCGSA